MKLKDRVAIVTGAGRGSGRGSPSNSPKQALAKEAAPHGVRVNCVSPGPIASEAGRSIPLEMKQNLAYQELSKSTGFGHFGEPGDIANLVAFLAPDDAKFITGQNYPVCGVMNLGLADRLSG